VFLFCRSTKRFVRHVHVIQTVVRICTSDDNTTVAPANQHLEMLSLSNMCM